MLADWLSGRMEGAWSVREVSRASAPRRGHKPPVPLTQLLPALTWHVMQETGMLAEHLFQLFREPLANSSSSDLRLRLPWEIFAELMRRALRRRATCAAASRGLLARVAGGRPRRHAIQSDQHAPDHATPSRRRPLARGRAAFAKMTAAVLLEVGLHNPLAAAIGRKGESEWVLAQRLLAQLPESRPCSWAICSMA